MRRQLLALALLVTACGAPGGAIDAARGPESDGGTPRRPSAAERLDTSAAGEELATLAALIGSWRVFVEEDQGGDLRPLAEGRADIELALSGRFLEWRTDVQLQSLQVRSRGLLGYDRDRELFELHWISELSSAQRIARGRGDARRGGLTLESADLDPETGGVRRARTVLRIEETDVFTMRQDTWDSELTDWRRLALTRYERLSPDDGSNSAPRPR